MIRVKAKDGTILNIVKKNGSVFAGEIYDIVNFETLSSGLDLITSEYKGEGQRDLGNGFSKCYGVNAPQAVKDNYEININVVDEYFFKITFTKQSDSQNAYMKIKLLKNTTDVGGGGSLSVAKYVEGAEELASWTYSTENYYQDNARLILFSSADKLENINNIYFGAFLQESSMYYHKWGNVKIQSFGWSSGSTSSVTDFFNKLKTLETVEEPITPNVPDIFGDYDNSSDNIALPELENINIMSSISSNLVKAYYIDKENINNLSGFLWSDNFIDTIKKIQNNPLENIQKLFYLPFDVEVSENEIIKIGNVNTDITGGRIIKQFQEIDFGNIDITEYYGNSLDYNTELSIFLPFIGEKSLNIYDVMASSLNLKYRIDIVTGNCIAILSVVRQQNNVTLNSVLYSYVGDMSNNIPLTASQNNFFKQLLGNIASPQSLLMNFGNQSIISGIGGGVSTSYSHTGNISGNNGFMSVLTPYLIIRRPVNIKPAKYEEIFGYPAYNSDSLVNQKGFIRFSELYIDNDVDISESEKNNLITLLKTDGVYI